MEVYGEIKGISYKPLLCKRLDYYTLSEMENALSQRASFMLRIDDKNDVAVSWWVSPKRTRSYPYARVYDTLSFAGKKVTIIPVIKDEGKGEKKKGCKGDRDFLQWDTISLMSLLGVYVIIGYYSEAERKTGCKNRITNQRFDVKYLQEEILKLTSYQSDALHWNLEQVDRVYQIAEKAFRSYEKISRRLGVKLHSMESAKRRIGRLYRNKENFIKLSRKLAHGAQLRESITVQPKEYLTGSKAAITIKNYLGGYYYFTADEVEIVGNNLFLVEGKHTKSSILPSEGDIKDALIKMILFTNLENVVVNGVRYNPVPVLKLTTNREFREDSLSERKRMFLNLLKREAELNGFSLKINDSFIV